MNPARASVGHYPAERVAQSISWREVATGGERFSILFRSAGNLSQRLKIDGGTPAFPDGPPAWPVADASILSSVNDALTSGQWGLYEGALLTQTRAALQQMWRLEHALLCCSGTVAVELALRGCGVKAGDEVILAAYDFPGNFRAIEAIGARPVLVDVLPNRWTMDPAQVSIALSASTSANISAVLVSHLHGEIADINSIAAIARDAGVKVVEDLCQAPGAMLGGRMLGTFGDVVSLSFGGSKPLSAGRGGALLCNDQGILQRAKIFAHRGNDAFPFSQIQAALLLPQLANLENANRRRLAAARKMIAALAALTQLSGLEEADVSGGLLPSFYKLPIRVGEDAPFSRTDFLAVIQAEGVALAEGFRGFVKRSNRRCRRVGDLGHARAAAAATMVLHHPVLLCEDRQIERLIETLGRAEKYLIS